MRGMHSIAMHTGSCVFPFPKLFKSRNRIQIRNKCKTSMLLLDKISCSFQWYTSCCKFLYLVPDNGWNYSPKLYPHLTFIISTQLTREPSEPLERAFFSQHDFIFTLYLCMIYGNIYEPVRIYTCRTPKQIVNTYMKTLQIIPTFLTT
jgi:hypothetical protein